MFVKGGSWTMCSWQFCESWPFGMVSEYVTRTQRRSLLTSNDQESSLVTLNDLVEVTLKLVFLELVQKICPNFTKWAPTMVINRGYNNPPQLGLHMLPLQVQLFHPTCNWLAIGPTFYCSSDFCSLQELSKVKQIHTWHPNMESTI